MIVIDIARLFSKRFDWPTELRDKYIHCLEEDQLTIYTEDPDYHTLISVINPTIRWNSARLLMVARFWEKLSHSDDWLEEVSQYSEFGDITDKCPYNLDERFQFEMTTEQRSSFGIDIELARNNLIDYIKTTDSSTIVEMIKQTKLNLPRIVRSVDSTNTVRPSNIVTDNQAIIFVAKQWNRNISQVPYPLSEYDNINKLGQPISHSVWSGWNDKLKLSEYFQPEIPESIYPRRSLIQLADKFLPESQRTGDYYELLSEITNKPQLYLHDKQYYWGTRDNQEPITTDQLMDMKLDEQQIYRCQVLSFINEQQVEKLTSQ